MTQLNHPKGIDRNLESLLEAGDILLSLSGSLPSRALWAMDGGRYSHAALWSGEDVIEAVAEHVEARSLRRSIEASRPVYIDVYRLRSDRGKAGVTEDDATFAKTRGNAASHAEKRIGWRYPAFDLLLATAFAVAERAVPHDAQSRLREQLEMRYNPSAFDDKAAERKEVLCPQLPLLAYRDAGVEICFSHLKAPTSDEIAQRVLAVLLWHKFVSFNNMPPGLEDELKQHSDGLEKKSVDDLRESIAGRTDGARDTSHASVHRADFPSQFVTLRDLQESPSLNRVGQLYCNADDLRKFVHSLHRAEKVLTHVNKTT
jgi:hypothetical protein